MTSELSLYILICVTTMITPGPGVLMTVSCSLRYGISHSYMCAIGNACGVFVMGLVSASGLGVLLIASPRAFAALQLIGALYLIWIGLKNWRDKGFDLLSLADTHQISIGPWRLFRDSALVQTTNPMLILFLLSLFPQFIVKESAFWPQACLLLLIFSVLGLGVHLGYAAIATYSRRLLQGRRAGWWVGKISASLFILLGVGVVWKVALDILTR